MKKLLPFSAVAFFLSLAPILSNAQGSFGLEGNSSRQYLSDKTYIPLFQEDEEWEDDGRGFSVGLNLGVYLGNKKSAAFYNGSCAYSIEGVAAGVRCYSIEERILLNGTNTNSILSYILTQYNATGLDFPVDMYPMNMGYKPSMQYGLLLKYNFDYTNSIVFNGNFIRLKAVDVFTLKLLGTTMQQNAQEDIRIFDISGEEDRFHFSLMYRSGAEINKGSNWFVQGGPSMVGIKVLSNQIFIGDRTFDLLIGAQNPNQLIVYQPRTDIGMGFTLGTGFEMMFNDKYEISLSLNASRERIVLGSFEDRIWNYAVLIGFTL